MTVVDVLRHAGVISLGLMFAASAWPKLRDPTRMATVVREYEILPTRLAVVAALILGPAEATVALALLTGMGVQLGLVAAATMLCAFAAAVAINLMRRRRIECGCFGDLSERISLRTLARLILAMSLAVTLAVIGAMDMAAWATTLELVQQPGGIVGAGSLVFLAVCGLQGGSWILNVDHLWSLIRTSAKSSARTGAFSKSEDG